MGIRSWKGFVRVVEKRRCHLLARLHEFPESVLVAGCQRSGTTIVTHILLGSEGIVDYRSGADSELDGALILSGLVDHEPRGRYVLQTTYVNEIEREYFNSTPDYRLIWMVRRPESVVFSMLRNWPRWTLDHLFRACGAELLTGADLRRYRRYGTWAVSPLQRACAAYTGKTSRVHHLHRHLKDDRLLVMDYDALVSDPHRKLRQIFEFAGLSYEEKYAGRLHGRSLKKADRLSSRARARVRERCGPTYEHAKLLARSTC